MSRRLLGTGVAVLFGILLGVYGMGGLLRIQQMHREIEVAERDIAALRVQTEKLTRTIDRLRNDPAYIEKLGREEHGLVREGETILKFPPKPK
ncbi:MAG TPA: septum formation initiator family protein [Methylomirabilota bacterium]|nr:septum formation initiator family protein [Methylomirabilota bacterium]